MNLTVSWWTVACRVVLGMLTLVTTVPMVYGFMAVVGADGVHVLDWPLIVVFTVLTVWVSFSFWAATLGLYVRITQRPRPQPGAERDEPIETLPRTALLVPIYNEDPASVFAGIVATCESLLLTKRHRAFEVFVLSDTRDPDIWLAEQRAWREVSRRFAGKIPIWYRRRSNNEAKKAGNVAEFCRRWGGRFELMIIFDADSVMTGKTMVEMVKRMAADPGIGILQAPPQPVAGRSLFARVQQYAASLYGDVFATGLQQWTGIDGNYWGHNAIIRVDPFIAHCDLPVLPGAPPFGGPILSHDFIEAALMRRAGYKVVLATDLRGSYERCPTNLIDFAQRDQRWCQGNMQHGAILCRRNLPRVSRMHLVTGIMSYLSAPLLVLFLVVGITQSILQNTGLVDAHTPPGLWPTVTEPFDIGVGLFVASMLMLLLPKLWAIFTLDTDRDRRRGHGDHGDAITSALCEMVISILIAPIMMLYHTRFVIGSLTGGKGVNWGGQDREARGVPLHTAVAAHGVQTVIGLGVMTLVAFGAPSLFWWLSPIGLGLVLAIPVSMMLGSVRAGDWSKRQGLFMIPEEVDEPRLLARTLETERELGHMLDAVTPPQAPWWWALLDPIAAATHANVLDVGGPPKPGDAAAAVPEPPVDIHAADALDRSGRLAVLGNADAMRRWRSRLWDLVTVDDLRVLLERSGRLKRPAGA